MTGVNIYKTNRNKLNEIFIYENLIADELFESIFYYGYDDILEEIYSGDYSVFCDFFKDNNLQYEYEDTIELTKNIYESIMKWLNMELKNHSLFDIANNIIGEDKALSMVNIYYVLSKLSIDWKNEILFFTSG